MYRRLVEERHREFWGNPYVLCVVTLGTSIILFPIIWWGLQAHTNNLIPGNSNIPGNELTPEMPFLQTTHKSSTKYIFPSSQSESDTKFAMRRSKRKQNNNGTFTKIVRGDIFVMVTEGISTSFTFDLKNTRPVNGIKWDEECYSLSAKYLCKPPCAWNDMFSRTNIGFLNHNHPLINRWSMIKQSPCRCNVRNGRRSKEDYSAKCNPLTFTIRNPTMADTGRYILGIEMQSTDALSQFVLKVQRAVQQPQGVATANQNAVQDASKYQVTYINITSASQTISLETGYKNTNTWLDWMVYSVNQMKISNCVACAVARPHLGTMPFPLTTTNDPKGHNCVLKLFSQPSPDNCTSFGLLFPGVSPLVIPPSFVAYKGAYDCYKQTSTGHMIGELTWCNTTTPVLDGAVRGIQLNNFSRAIADVWWYCGTKTLYPTLPKNWTGVCALVQLVMSFAAARLTPEQLQEMAIQTKVDGGYVRRKRYIPAGSFDKSVYIDAIGVPRGVPDEFKARNQVAAGFESIFLWPTINKNVDWINYIYYNQQRFVNYTRDAIKGLHEQLDKTSLMAWQNRMALDMLLAKEGGVCKMFGNMCCTFIPNNTAPDGSVTRALAGLTTLSSELAENSGVDSIFGDWMEKWFGKYTSYVESTLTSVAVFIAIIVPCGCCCIPCIRTLLHRLITTALSKETASPIPMYQMPLLASGIPSDSEEEQDVSI